MIIRDVGFPIHTEDRSISINACDRIIEVIDITLIKADWKHHAQFFCKTYSHCHSFTLLHSSCIAVKIISALLAEIFPLKKFRQ